MVWHLIDSSIRMNSSSRKLGFRATFGTPREPRAPFQRPRGSVALTNWRENLSNDSLGGTLLLLFTFLCVCVCARSRRWIKWEGNNSSLSISLSLSLFLSSLPFLAQSNIPPFKWQPRRARERLPQVCSGVSLFLYLSLSRSLSLSLPPSPSLSFWHTPGNYHVTRHLGVEKSRRYWDSFVEELSEALLHQEPAAKQTFPPE